MRYIKFHGGKTHPDQMGKTQIDAFLSHLTVHHLLLSKILYGCGLRLMECVRLRLKDLDFDRNLIYVYEAKVGEYPCCAGTPGPQ